MPRGVTADDLKSARGGEPFLRMMRFQIERAESYYDRSAALDDRIASDSRPTLVAMTEIYRGLLHKIAQEPERGAPRTRIAVAASKIANRLAGDPLSLNSLSKPSDRSNEAAE